MTPSQDDQDRYTAGCAFGIIALVTVIIMGFTGHLGPQPQRVREKSWTAEEKEAAARPVGERIGRSVGKFGVDFGRGVWKGAVEDQKK